MLGLNDARRAGLLGGTALALIAAFGGRAALALDECGPANAGDTVTCTPAGNSFPNGIQYKVDDLTIVVQGGVVINTNANPGISTGGAGNYGDLAVKTGTGAGITITTDSANNDAIFAQSKDGNISIIGAGDLTTGGPYSSGIEAITEDGGIEIGWQGDVTTLAAFSTAISAVTNAVAGTITITSAGDISAAGVGAGGVYAKGNNIVRVISTGDIATKGEDGFGISTYSKNSSTQVYSTGDITTLGKDAAGIQAFGEKGAGVFSVGNITTSGNNSVAIYVQSNDNTAVADSKGAIATSGKFSSAIIVTGTDDAEVIARASGSIVTTGYGSVAIGAKSETGDVEVRSYAALSTAGTYADGISAISDTGSIRIRQTGDIATKGNAADGIIASTDGSIEIVSVANITIGGSANGILGYSVKDDVSITSTGNIVTTKNNSDGINAFAKDGAVFITSIGGIATKGDGSGGIEANAAGEGVILKSTGNISTAGEYAVGIFASSKMDLVEITSSGTIITSGDGSDGIAGYGSYVGITHTGSVMTSGVNAEAIRAAAENDSVDVELTGNAITKGEDAAGIFARSDDAGVRVTVSGDVRTFGKSSNGIDAASEDVAVIEAHNVITTGRYSSGIFVYSQTENRVTVSGTVLGGWDGGVGVFLDQSKASSLAIGIGGVVGALSDFAIDQDDDTLNLSNNGAIVGSFFFDDGDDQLFNFETGGVHLRQFADSNGDLTRDKEGVALGNFDADNDSFDNRGVLQLATVSGATTWDTTGQILHPGGGNSDITQQGVEQGFLLGLEEFKHSGLITLADGVAGDLLVITDQDDGKTKGANVFTSNGGALALDAVLDDGSSKQSDVLILDKAKTGSGATRVLIGNAGGNGGQTTGDGILVINVRDKSDADAFVSGGPAVSGAYQYDLHYQNVAKTDENWYLRSSFFEGALEYPSIVSGALLSWYSDLNGLHDRMGERRAQVENGQVASLQTAMDMADSGAVRMNSGGDGGWLKVSGADMDIEQDGPADFDLNAVRATAGFDLGFNNILDGQDWLVLGAMAGYGWSSAGFESGSELSFDIATVGAYATYFRGPYYLDALVKFDWLDGRFNSDNAGADVELPVFGLSLETGYRFDLTPDGLYLQPRAQLSYAHSGDDSIADNGGSPIELEEADSLRGRLGARVGQELSTTAGAAGEPVTGNFYLEAAVNQEFLGEAEARVSGLTLEQELPGTTFEIGGGIDIALPKEGVTFTVDADYTLGDEAEGISATGGFRINW